MFTNEDPVTLGNLGDGAAIEKFNDELQKVLDNIIDPNTKADMVREIVLKVRLKPDENRNVAAISIVCGCKLAPDSEFITSCMIGKVGNTGLAREMKTQQSLFVEGEDEKVVGIDQKPKHQKE